MSKITSFQVGLESLSHLPFATKEHESLPSRHQLRPDGAPVRAHLAQLFDIYPAQRLLQEGMKPEINESRLLRPEYYRHLFFQLNQQANSFQLSQNKENGQALANLFAVMEQDQLWLSMGFNLLIKA